MSAAALTSTEHYENFPVASILVPARLRPPIAAIYRFARHADDLADEGEASSDARLQALDALAADLRVDRPANELVAALRSRIAPFQLPIEPFEALLSAFRQDVTTNRYPDAADLADYCRRSADPIGELLLRLFGAWNDQTALHSSQICSALQLINFLQDTAGDWSRGRLYLPLDALDQAGLDESSVAQAAQARRASPVLRAVLAEQAARSRRMLESGSALIGLVPGRLSLELRAIVAGGTRILDLLAAGGHDPFARRPRLHWRDAVPLAALWWKAGR